MTKNMRTVKGSLVLEFRILSFCIIILVVAVVFTVNYFGERKTEEVVRNVADTVLSSSPAPVFAGMKPPVLGERLRVKGLGKNFGYVFSSGNGNGLFFVVPVTDNAGPVLSVFYFSAGSGISFIGNCCQSSLDRASGSDMENAGRNLSPGILKGWVHRLENIALRIVNGGPGISTGASAK